MRSVVWVLSANLPARIELPPNAGELRSAAYNRVTEAARVDREQLQLKHRTQLVTYDKVLRASALRFAAACLLEKHESHGDAVAELYTIARTLETE